MNVKHYGNLIQITRLKAFNSYLLLEEDGITIIDTNLPMSAKGILKVAAQFNKPIHRIVLTHAHNDHVASLDALHTQLPDVEVLISERAARLLAGDTTLLPGEPSKKPINSPTKTKPTRTVNDGDMIGSLKVIASPGHSPGHIALLDTRDNTLIAGDAFSTQFKTVVAGKMVLLFPFPAQATWDKALSLDSAKKLRTLNPTRLAVGHGPVIENPLAEMDAAIAEAERSFGGKADAVSRPS